MLSLSLILAQDFASPMHTCGAFGSIACMGVLLQSGVPPDLEDADVGPALLAAMDSGNAEDGNARAAAVGFLVSEGAALPPDRRLNARALEAAKIFAARRIASLSPAAVGAVRSVLMAAAGACPHAAVRFLSNDRRRLMMDALALFPAGESNAREGDAPASLIPASAPVEFRGYVSRAAALVALAEVELHFAERAVGDGAPKCFAALQTARGVANAKSLYAAVVCAGCFGELLQNLNEARHEMRESLRDLEEARKSAAAVARSLDGLTAEEESDDSDVE